MKKNAVAGAQAEKLFGATQDLRDFVFIDLGHNLSMAFSAQGKIFSPSNPHAGAVGRVRLCQESDASGEGPLTLNEQCSSVGMVRQALATQASHWDPQVTIYQIINAAHNDDPYAIEILGKAGASLGGHHLAPYIHLLRPEAIILGFPASLAGEIFSEPVFKAAQQSTGLGLDEMPPRIIPSPLGARLPELQAIAPSIHATRYPADNK